MHVRAYTPTLAQAVFPGTGLWRHVAVIGAFNLLLIATARIAVYLPFSPVPITGQTLGVLLTGAALGSRWGAFMMALYLGEAWLGLPVLAGGSSGAFWTIPSGGYLVGFVAAAYVVGFLAEHAWDRRPRVILALLAGTVIIYLFGLSWLGLHIAQNWLGLYDIIPGNSVLDKTLMSGLYPYIPGDVIKLYLAALVLPSAWALLRWKRA